MIRCLVFDFDGTLVPSNGIKRQAFIETVEGIDGAGERIEALLAARPTVDRHTIFTMLCRQTPDAGGPAALVARYGEICEARIVPLLVGSDVRSLMEALVARGLDLHISSATPRDALLAILDAAGMTSLFRSVHGAPQEKRDAVEEILAAGNHSAAEVAVIGDGAQDRQAAATHGCRFVGVSADASELSVNSAPDALSFLAERLDLPDASTGGRDGQSGFDR